MEIWRIFLAKSDMLFLPAEIGLLSGSRKSAWALASDCASQASQTNQHTMTATTPATEPVIARVTVLVEPKELKEKAAKNAINLRSSI